MFAAVAKYSVLEIILNTERLDRSHSSIHTATAVDRSNPRAPRRRIAKAIVSNGRRLRQRIGVVAGICIGLTALLIAFE